MKLRAFLKEGHRMVRKERPATLARIHELLLGKTLGVGLGGERVAFTVERDALAFVRPDSARLDLECRASRETFFSLLDGRTQMSQAIFQRDVEVMGDYEAILSFHGAMELLLRSTRGSPAFSGLVRRFRTDS